MALIKCVYCGTQLTGFFCPWCNKKQPMPMLLDDEQLCSMSKEDLKKLDADMADPNGSVNTQDPEPDASA